MSAEHFINQLIFCITTLTTCRSNLRDVVANLEVSDVRADFVTTAAARDGLKDMHVTVIAELA